MKNSILSKIFRKEIFYDICEEILHIESNVIYDDLNKINYPTCRWCDNQLIYYKDINDRCDNCFKNCS